MTGRERTVGFSVDRGKVSTLEESPLPPPENALRVPRISGNTIGSIQFVRKDAEGTAQETEIVCAVAGQPARRLDAAQPPGADEKPAP